MTTARSAFDKISEDGRALLRGSVEIIIDGGDVTTPDSLSFYLHDPNKPGFKVTEQRDFATNLKHDLSSDERRKVIEKVMNYIVDDLHVSTFAIDFEQLDDHKEHLEQYLKLL